MGDRTARKNELENAIKFGRSASSLAITLDETCAMLDSSVWSAIVKKEIIARNIKTYQLELDRIITLADTLYKGIETAKTTTEYLQKIMDKLNAKAKQYM